MQQAESPVMLAVYFPGSLERERPHVLVCALRHSGTVMDTEALRQSGFV